MPRIKELAVLKHNRLGYSVDSLGRTHGYSLGDLETHMSSNPNASRETINLVLESGFSIPDCQVRVHCFSKEPLELAFNVVEDGVKVPDNWWEIP
ncbi:MAG: hypothetical protein AMS15_09475 [Planctomycetes bacterium DG_23]|nr:MAG: hypothetical protein AMS15_09475 [Planctomycetes bacterium DG_23]